MTDKTIPSDLPRLLAAFDSGALVRPRWDVPNWVDLVRAIAHANGVTRFELSPAAQDIRDRIGDPEHLVFVLVDGLGTHLLNQNTPDAWLLEHMAFPIQPVYPATTACAISSLATGEWPCTHGVLGWWTWLPHPGVTATVLPFSERFTKDALVHRGVTVDRVVRSPSWLVKTERDACVVIRKSLTDSPYSRFFRGRATTSGFQTVPQAVDLAIAHVQSARKRPTYTYVYIDIVDSLCHLFGNTHDDVIKAMRTVDTELKRLGDFLSAKDNARLLVCADHGHINVPQEKRCVLAEGDPAMDLLQFPPAGDSRVQYHHVKPDQETSYAQRFREQYGNHFALITPDEAESIQLYGPDPLTQETRRRAGTFISIALDNARLKYLAKHDNSNKPPHSFIGQHSGLLPAEMEVPLVIW